MIEFFLQQTNNNQFADLPFLRPDVSSADPHDIPSSSNNNHNSSVSSFRVDDYGLCDIIVDARPQTTSSSRRVVQIREDCNVYYEANYDDDEYSNDNQSSVPFDESSLLWYKRADTKRFRRENSMVAKTIGFLLDHQDAFLGVMGDDNDNDDDGDNDDRRSSAWLKQVQQVYQDLCHVETVEEANHTLMGHLDDATNKMNVVDPSVWGLEKIILISIGKDRLRRRKDLRSKIIISNHHDHHCHSQRYDDEDVDDETIDEEEEEMLDVEQIRAISRQNSRPSRLLAYYMAVQVARQVNGPETSSYCSCSESSDRIDF